MSVIRDIPNSMNPFVCEINGRRYSYPAGTQQSVPEEVASIIDSFLAAKPREAAKPTVEITDDSITAGKGAVVDFTGADIRGLPQAANVPGAAGTNVTKSEFKALLDALIAAGMMAKSS